MHAPEDLQKRKPRSPVVFGVTNLNLEHTPSLLTSSVKCLTEALTERRKLQLGGCRSCSIGKIWLLTIQYRVSCKVISEDEFQKDALNMHMHHCCYSKMEAEAEA